MYIELLEGLLTLTILFGVSVCFNRGQSSTTEAFPVTRTFHLESEHYNGLYVWDLNTGFQPLSGSVTFVVRGNTILGRGIRNVIYPIYDSERHLIVIEAGVHRRVSTQLGNSYGLFSNYYISRPESRPQHQRFSLIPASEANLTDVYYFPGNSRILHPVSRVIRLVEKIGTNTIIGWYANHFVHPIYNEQEHLIVQDTVSGINREITPTQGVELGVYSRIPIEPGTSRSRMRRPEYRSRHGQTSDGRFERSRSPRRALE